MAQEVTIHQMSMSDMNHMADAFAKSGLFGVKTREQALALMLVSQAEGRHPALAARDYDIIQGKPTKKAEAMVRDFQAAGGKIEWHRLDNEVAEATFSHESGGTYRCNWDMKRASEAGLAGKENWKKFPRQMLRSRCVSEGVRTVLPMATSGMYEPNEIADLGHEPQADMRDVTPPRPTRDTPPSESRAPIDQPSDTPPPAKHEFEIVTWDGEIRTFEKASDYLAGLREAFDAAVDKQSWWADHTAAFTELHSKVVQANKNKAAIAAFGEVSRYIADTLTGRAA